MSSENSIDLYRTEPGTLAGRYLRSFWQPVYRARDLPAGETVPLRIMSEDFTLYRGQTGMPHLVAFRCAHRGTQLSAGWVEDDCIRCFYHGWKYDSSGQCVEQPGEDASFKSKIKIRSYPTEEYLGLIFVYLREGTAPPFPRYPDLDASGIVHVLLSEEWPCNYFNRLDNLGDPVHVPFTHRESRSRIGIDVVVPDRLIAEESEVGIKLTRKLTGGKTETRYILMPNMNHLRHPLRIKGPIAKQLGEGSVDRFLWRVPIENDRCLGLGVDIVHLVNEDAKKKFLEFSSEAEANGPSHIDLAESVLRGKAKIKNMTGADNYELTRIEDYVAQVGQGAIADYNQFHLGRNDAVVILFRKIWERELRALAEGTPMKLWKTLSRADFEQDDQST
jgi:5,5'-dehydrodivanillate O-demethylase oxygenase subunit